MTNQTGATKRRSRRTMLTLFTIVALALGGLTVESTSKWYLGVAVVAILVALLLIAWALTARYDRGVARGRVTPLETARSQLDVGLVRAARAEHGEFAGVTEVRRQLPSLTFDEAVKLHRYV
ncbi:hypothetical protein ACPPVS_14480 [Cellulomonas sp. McL0617]|uniref:hypothetical protein n=1 Tax=Cellulomonas sp. McL0617 TaxID=3415675 RepID=UPI003CEF4EAF